MESFLEIPDKSVFKVNEVCGITGVKPYVLRFWESEFEEISPITSSSGQKLYEHKDIEAISSIKKLLFEDKMSVEQARFALRRCSDDEAIVEPLSDCEIEDTLIETVEATVEEVHQVQSFGKYLSDLEIQKLVLAKAKLNSIIQSIDTFQFSC